MSVLTRGFAFLLLSLGASAPWAGQKTPFRWPEIKPTSKSYNFQVASRTDALVRVEDPEGEVLYVLGCLADFPAEDGTAAGIGCYLVLAGSEDAGLNSATLLNDDPMERRIPHGRGQIWADALQGSCASYPEYGAERTFSLRGMKIVIRVRDVVFGAPREYQNPARTVSTILSLAMKITVISDPGALSAISEPIPIGPPKSRELDNPWNSHPDCSSLVPAHIPGNLSDRSVEKEAMSGPFPHVARQQTSLLLNADLEEDSPVTSVRQPMPPRSRMISWRVQGPDGGHVYDFACSGYEAAGGSFDGRDIPRRFDRYGVVCGLFLPGKDFNLLAENLDPYSLMSPAQILPAQLHGDCNNYPEWGGERVFRLRGMRLTMRFSDAVFTMGDFGARALVSARLALEVEPDPEASSPVALGPKIIYWGFLGGLLPCRAVLVPAVSGPRR